MLHGLLRQDLVVQNVAVADHDAFRRRGRCRRVLKEGQRVRPGVRIDPPRRFVEGDVTRDQPVESGQPGGLIEARQQLVVDDLGRHGHLRPGVVEDGRQALQVVIRPRRIAGDGHGAGGEAGVEGGDVLRAAGIEQEDALSPGAELLQPRGEGEDAPVELGEGEALRFGAAAEERVSARAGR